MSAKKKTAKTAKTEAGKRERHGRNVNVWIDGELGEALDRYLDTTRYSPTLTAVVEVALKELLSREGYWPPPAVEN